MRLSICLFITAIAGSSAFAPTIVPSSSSAAISASSSSGTSSSTALGMTVLTYKNKKKNFKAGSPLSKAVAQLGVPVKYSCKKGDCATCQISLAGRMTRCCTGKVPDEPKLKSLQEKGLEIKA